MNRILKRRARQLYGRNLGRLLLVYLVNLCYLLLTTLFPAQLQGWLRDLGLGDWGGFLAATVLQILLMVLLAPIGFGIIRYVYLLQKDRAPRTKEVFHYFTGAGRYGRAVAAGIVQSFPSYLGVLCVSLMDEAGPEPVQTGLLFLVVLIYGFFFYWHLHICLLPYILVEDERAGLGHIRRESFRLMRGNCLRYFWLELSFIGWYLLITVIVTAVLMATIMPTILDYASLGLVLPDSIIQPYLLWAEAGVYLCMTLLSPYIALASAAFGDAALQGQLDQLVWQGQAPYGGWPNTTGWQQPGPPPTWQAPPQGPPPYPPHYPQGGGWGPGPNTTGWQGQPGPGPGQQPAQPSQPSQPQGEPYTAAQQEEYSQYQLYSQGQPMTPRSFTSYGTANDLGSFLPWPQVERGDLYSFLKLESWMPGMVAAAWQQAASGMAAQVGGTGAVVKRTITESLNGSRFTVTVILSDDPAAGCWQVCIQIEIG